MPITREELLGTKNTQPSQIKTNTGMVGISREDLLSGKGSTNTQKQTSIQDRQSMIDSGQAVSTNKRFERTGKNEPNIGGQIARGLATIPTKLAASAKALTRVGKQGSETFEPIRSNYLGDVYGVGLEPQYEAAKLAEDEGRNMTREEARKASMKGLRQGAGYGLEVGSFYGGGAGVAKGALPSTLSALATRTGLKQVGSAATRTGLFEAGAGALGGAGQALQDDPRKLVENTIMGGVAGGLLGGAVGAAGPIAGSVARPIRQRLAKTFPGLAIPDKTLINEMNKSIDEGISQAIKPTGRGQRTAKQKLRFEEQAREAMKAIIENEPNLKVTTESGEVINGIPDDIKISEFPQLMQQQLDTIYRDMDARMQRAGQRGAQVNIIPILNDLNKIVNNKSRDSKVRKHAFELANELTALNNASPIDVQTRLQDMSTKLAANFLSPQDTLLSRVDTRVYGQLKEAVDKAIMAADVPGLGALKKRYAGIKQLEQPIVNQILKMARKSKNDLLSIGEPEDVGIALYGALTLNPALVASSATSGAIRKLLRALNDPERAFQGMIRNLKEIRNQRPELFKIEQMADLEELPAATALYRPGDTANDFEPQAQQVFTQTERQLPEPLGLPAATSNAQGPTIRLPEQTQTRMDMNTAQNALPRSNFAAEQRMANTMGLPAPSGQPLGIPQQPIQIPQRGAVPLGIGNEPMIPKLRQRLNLRSEQKAIRNVDKARRAVE